ncbi:ATP synthase F1 subunit gamma [Tepidiforma bonchosmolovskayae]|uniref:ATP synthase gamma chain n=1 Tax=Tepidiforma bonchosmolovskayae TaxID=2601677 RepID=A0ABX6C0G9_9CHLR|nr:ATP synthase F1 subunit gamma [Tepidiforma bonchosmolovskayae]QFG01911.1 ATP synthase F1 subunit gamma [Tepidiforma bonchosmolovskayae]
MATIRQLRRRIQSVKNTAKITNALQLVAASKMRRAQDRALQAKPYAEKLRTVIAGLAAATVDPEKPAHPLLVTREVKNIALLHITPDRGLCGGLNSNLNRSAGTFVATQREPVEVIAVGKKGRDFFIRARVNVIAEFTDLGDYPGQAQVAPIARLVIDDYLAGLFDRVYVSYPEFVSTATQRPVIRQLLPIEPPRIGEDEAGASTFAQDYIFEPSPDRVLAQLLPRYVEMQVYEAVLQNAASFQSAQMVAMKNATDNANEITRDLTLTYNKARQEQITKELLDIVGGAAALEG